MEMYFRIINGWKYILIPSFRPLIVELIVDGYWLTGKMYNLQQSWFYIYIYIYCFKDTIRSKHLHI